MTFEIKQDDNYKIAIDSLNLLQTKQIQYIPYRGFKKNVFLLRKVFFFTNLYMTKLGYLKTRVGNRDWSAGFQAMEKPLFNRVVVQWAVDINGPYRSVINTL